MINKSDILNANLLIVDDQYGNVLLLEKILSGAGYTSITSTQNSSEVYELHHKNHYDLIILDLHMPIMDGYEVIKAIKDNKEAYPLTRIIVISATSYQNFIKKEDPCHISGYIQKPINKAKLLELLTEAAIEVTQLQQLKIK